MKRTTNIKKAVATLITAAMAMTALAAGGMLVYNMTGKVLDSCYCQPIGGKMICSGTCQGMGECCCCTPQANR